MFWMNNKTYYLSMDANNPTDNSSQTENNVNTAIKNFNSETSQNTFKFYFPPRNKLYYKNLLTLVKRLSVWFDHIMMSLIWCFDNFRKQISNNRKLKKRRKIYYPVPPWQSQVSRNKYLLKIYYLTTVVILSLQTK